MDKDCIMGRTITDVRWANDLKTQLFCKFRYDNGKEQDAFVSETKEGNPDWKEIMETFPIETIEKNTDRYLDQLKISREQNLQNYRESQQNMKNEELFNIKLELFGIDEIKNSKNVKMKSRIRKAKTFGEAQVLASVLMMMEMQNANTETSK